MVSMAIRPWIVIILPVLHLLGRGRGPLPARHRARLTKCLLSLASRIITQLHPFVSPSGTVGQQVFVSPITMACNAPLAASGITGAPAATVGTQGRIAKSESEVQALDDKFNPLPLFVVSPIKVDVLERLLAGYPCPSTSRYLITGFRYGFDIGFRGSFEDPNARPRNLRSARENVEQVSEAVLKELVRGHTSGPFPYPLLPTLIVRPLAQPLNPMARLGSS